MTTRPPQSIVSAACHVAASAPTATIASPVMATAPGRWIVNCASIVMTTALSSSRSQREGGTAGLYAGRRISSRRGLLGARLPVLVLRGGDLQPGLGPVGGVLSALVPVVRRPWGSLGSAGAGYRDDGRGLRLRVLPGRARAGAVSRLHLDRAGGQDAGRRRLRVVRHRRRAAVALRSSDADQRSDLVPGVLVLRADAAPYALERRAVHQVSGERIEVHARRNLARPLR